MTEIIQRERERVPGKLGKLAARRPDMADVTSYATGGVLPDPPAAVDWTRKIPTPLGMLGNDRVGDCTIAAVVHQRMSWAAEVGTRAPTFTTDQVIEEYLTLSGGKDTGLVEADVLRTWRADGILGQRLDAYAPIEPAHLLGVAQAIWLFGGVYAGIRVPVNAQRQFARGLPWSFGPLGVREAYHLEIVGGHAIPLLGYDDRGPICVTWGAVQRMTWEWWAVYGEEAYACIGAPFVAADGANHLDLDTLRADLDRIT